MFKKIWLIIFGVLFLAAVAWAANVYIGSLTADTSPTSDDLIETENDPGGTPASRKVALGNAITKAHGLSDGMLKVASGVMQDATAGTDYLTPSGDGSSLTNLNGSAIASGTVADARIAATIARDTEITATKLDDFATPDDNTDLNATTTYHGLLPKLDNNSGHFLDGTGAWSTPSGGGNVSTSGTPVANDFARFTDSSTIEGRSYAETRADLSLEPGTDIEAWLDNPTGNDGILKSSSAGTRAWIEKGSNNTVLGVNDSGTLGYQSQFRSTDSAPQFSDDTTTSKLFQIVCDNISASTTRQFDTGDYNSQAVLATDVDASGHVTSGTSLALTGDLSGNVPVTLDTAATVSLTAAQCRGGMRINNDNDVIDYTLPAASAGLSVSFYSKYAAVVTVDTADATDTIILDGTSLTAGNAIDSPGAAGDFISLLALDSSTWITLGRSGAWIDGGAD